MDLPRLSVLQHVWTDPYKPCVAQPGLLPAPAQPRPALLAFAGASNPLSSNGGRALDNTGHPQTPLAPQGRAMPRVGQSWCPTAQLPSSIIPSTPSKILGWETPGMDSVVHSVFPELHIHIRVMPGF